jgi:hypothetical protein
LRAWPRSPAPSKGRSIRTTRYSDENAAILVAETLTGNASPSTAPLKKAQEAVLFHRVLDQFTP